MDEDPGPSTLEKYEFFADLGVGLSVAYSVISFGVGILLKWLISPLLIGYSIGHYIVYGLCQLSSQIVCPAESPYASYLLGPGVFVIGQLLTTGPASSPLARLEGLIKSERDLVNFARYTPSIPPVIAVLMYTPAEVGIQMAVPAVIASNGSPNETDVISSTYVGCGTTEIAGFLTQWTVMQGFVVIGSLWLAFKANPDEVVAALVTTGSTCVEEKISQEKRLERAHRQRRINYFALVLSITLTVIGCILLAAFPTMTYNYMQLELLTTRSEYYIVATFMLAVLVTMAGMFNTAVFIAGDKMYQHIASHHGVYFAAAPLTILSQLLAGGILAERIKVRNFDRFCFNELPTEVPGERRLFYVVLEHDWILHGAVAAICALLILCYKTWCEFAHENGEVYTRGLGMERSGNVEDEKNEKSETYVDLNNPLLNAEKEIKHTDIEVPEKPVYQLV